ncbi:MAG: nodulation protein NfeD [Hydrogenovibrio sp.]|uniref:NfeD family protein n=1 Tax=Hydrogenovibrio sp. TaxID=2065821 RepID=UPI0028709E86|nr:nodulation protein NfeD [Hydrogenovibrio sp.]MDR9499788.1 nodulation protein NfeD [Hydrogenovibrio sp.]
MMKRWMGILLWWALGTTLALAESSRVQWIMLEGSINPGSESFLQEALGTAQNDAFDLSVIQLNTPGGLSTSMRDMVQSIANADRPVVVWVGPSGARATSAGTFLVYASHLAAMAPGTHLGSATPVSLGEGETPSAKQTKAMEDAAALIRGLAEQRGRNADWAEKAIIDGVSLTAEQALEKGVIEWNAASRAQLLQTLDGQTLEVNGRSVTLRTAQAQVVERSPDWQEQFLSVITHPNVVYVLLLIGFYGLVFEFLNPGVVFSGVIGAVALVLALYGLNWLPVNWAGLLLIALGLAFMVAEAYQPSFGLLGLGGVASLATGSVLLLDIQAPGYGIDGSLIAAMTLLSLLLVVGVAWMAAKAYQRQQVSGKEGLLGDTVVALEDFEQAGSVLAQGEHWQAQSDSPVKKGQKLNVTGLDGLVLKVTTQARNK